MSPRLDPARVTLPPKVADALAAPTGGARGVVAASGRRWTYISWGRSTDPPLLLVHGVTSNALIWWRVGPALAAADRHVVAVDLPGHGADSDWQGRHRFDQTAKDVVEFVSAAGLDEGRHAVVGHSWGAMVVAHLPIVGIRPIVLILIDPPALTVEQLEALTDDPTERRHATLDAAKAAVREANPAWSDGDVEAKALALTEFDEEAVLAVLTRNGDYDAGLSALRHERAAGLTTWLIRGEWASGGLIPDDVVADLAAQLGPDRIVTISGASHAPQRMHPEATTFAILQALDAG